MIARYWDLSARVQTLEDRLDSSLDELQRRYQRAEQAERRMDQKREENGSGSGRLVPVSLNDRIRQVNRESL